MSDEDGKIETADGLTPVWRRIMDHRVVQWTVAYVALAYGIQHAVTLTTESMDWPHVINRASILLLALGLPVVVAVAWYHGGRAARRVSGAELAIISLLLVGI